VVNITALNTILANEWDGTICTEPSFITLSESNFRAYTRIVGTQIANNDSRISDVLHRKFYDPSSYDGYICKISSETSEADLLNMRTAIIKVITNYTPTSAENILEWEGGTFNPFNGVRWEFEFIIIVKKAGIAAY